MKYMDDTCYMRSSGACIYFRTTNILSETIDYLSVKQKSRDKIYVKLKVRTVKEIVTTTDLIIILRFASISSSFSIHFSTYKKV